ncbi:Translation initiation factor 3 family protein, putative isoform 1 [Cucumis melo var. makuwa]|uniref:Translation initiation factor 3 N-terminal domain-containing protein n=2 Tax=Cucumis melo TaxID=3656 RepID=A0A9I9DMD3_CUCME|nr:Translation initiation factor 3 family protein, putative isoform 1 [Cucumis melo var. makuwa]TYJ99532.1 Translation initiation factor 3 family protein, putative isoform 1 [Cucumis melo var. makuwa]
MALFCRISQSKLKSFLDQFKRHYFQISHSAALDSRRTTNHVYRYVERIPRRPADFADNFRFYAAPVQFQGNAKKEEKDKSGPRLNDKIKADFVRLVSDDGHTILPLREALERARELKLDLVEVQQKANPPVCKLMDFHREKYKKQIREKDRVKSKVELVMKKAGHKEVRFTGKTEEKDLKMKADMVKRLMERGYRVKCTARGDENQDLGALLSRLSAMIEDVALVESGPSVEKGQAFIIVRHVKFGPSKKGGGSKASKVAANAEQKVQNGSTPPISAVDPEDDAESSEETTWRVDGTSDCDEAFDLKDDRDVITSTTATKKMNVVSDRDVPDSGRTSSVPLFREDSSIKIDNRPKKIEPMNRFQPPNVTDRYSQGARDSLRSGPQIREPMNRFQPPNVTDRYSQGARDSLRSEPQIREPMNRFQPPNVTDRYSRGARDSLRSEPQIRDQRWHPPPNTNFSPTMRETRQYDNNTSVSRNINHSSNATSKPGPSHHTDSSPSKTSFGIFSSPNSNAPGKQDPPATGYQGNRGPPYTRSTNPNVPGVAENTKFPIKNSEDNSNKGQKSWGIFSK